MTNISLRKKLHTIRLLIISNTSLQYQIEANVKNAQATVKSNSNFLQQSLQKVNQATNSLGVCVSVLVAHEQHNSMARIRSQANSRHTHMHHNIDEHRTTTNTSTWPTKITNTHRPIDSTYAQQVIDDVFTQFLGLIRLLFSFIFIGTSRQ